MANFEIDEEVLVAFLKGELDAAQAAAVEAWYDRSAANRRMLGQVYYILYVSDRINDAAGIDVERSLRQFKRRMHAGRRISLRRSAVRIAAAAVIAAVLLAGGLTTVLLSKRLAQPVTVVTQLGERSQVVLPDGTKVWLNGESRLKYNADFSGRTRDVALTGEAFFEVRKDTLRPFRVSMNDLQVEVLGTALGEPIVYTVDASWVLGVGFILALLAAALPQAGETVPLGRRTKAGVWGIVLCVIALSFVTALNWTPINYTTIFGLQGRYWLPVLPLVLALVHHNRTFAVQKPAERKAVFAMLCLTSFVILQGAGLYATFQMPS